MSEQIGIAPGRRVLGLGCGWGPRLKVPELNKSNKVAEKNTLAIVEGIEADPVDFGI